LDKSLDTIDAIHAVQQELAEHEIFFFYSGFITEELLLSVGNAIKKKLELVQADRKTSRAVFAIFVEEVQNIIRYSKSVLQSPENSNEDADSLRHGFLSIGRREKGYIVCCGNLVLNEDAERLGVHLENLQKMDIAAIKQIYKETLRNPPPENSKGAGVGFMDIARRANGGFDFRFKDVDDAHKFFYLRAYT